MIKPIVRDMMFLGRKSTPATAADAQIFQDLRDTLAAHREECVGMAANMIGYQKNVIIVSMGIADVVMVNPVITKKSEPYDTEEGCLSLAGVRKTRRYQKITVAYEDENFRKHTQSYEGWTAEIIQHEVDHLSGTII